MRRRTARRNPGIVTGPTNTMRNPPILSPTMKVMGFIQYGPGVGMLSRLCLSQPLVRIRFVDWLRTGLFADCLWIVCGLFVDCLWIACRLFVDCLWIVRGLFVDCSWIGLDWIGWIGLDGLDPKGWTCVPRLRPGRQGLEGLEQKGMVGPGP